MKKALIITLSVLLCLAIAALGAWGFTRWQTRQEELSAARERLNLHWEEYLDFRETLDSTILWAIEGIDPYAQNPTWDNLLRARAAAAAAWNALKKVQAPSSTVDAQTLEVLHDYKEELVPVQDHLSSAALDLTDARNFLTQMRYNLEDLFLYKTDVAATQKHIALRRQTLTGYSRYVSLLTNHLYRTWGMADRWEPLMARCPTLAAHSQPWENNAKLLDTLADQALDQYTTAALGFSALNVLGETSLDALNQVDQFGNWAPLKSLIEIPQGMPAVWPGPFWVQEPSQIHYFVPGEEGKNTILHAGDDLSRLPTSVFYYYDYVTREEYDLYLQDLKDCGATLLSEDTEEGGVMTFAFLNDSVLVAEWNRTQTILTLRDPIPCLVSPIDFIALSME